MAAAAATAERQFVAEQSSSKGGELLTARWLDWNDGQDVRHWRDIPKEWARLQKRRAGPKSSSDLSVNSGGREKTSGLMNGPVLKMENI